MKILFTESFFCQFNICLWDLSFVARKGKYLADTSRDILVWIKFKEQEFFKNGLWFHFFLNISVSQFNYNTLKSVKAPIGQCKNLATLKLLSRKLFSKHRYKTWYSAKKDHGTDWSISFENCCSLVTKTLLENTKR